MRRFFLIKRILENPIYISEIRRGLRSKKIFMVLTLYLIILGIALYMVWLASGNDMMRGQDIGKRILATISVIQLIMILLICPSFTCNSISGEKERKTYDLLVTSLMNPTDILLGKLLHAVTYSTLFLISSLPFTCAAFFFGGVSPIDIIFIYISLIILSLLISLLGIYYSSRLQGTNAAIRSAYLSVFLFGLLGLNMISLLLYTPIPNIPFIFFHLPVWLLAFLEVFWIIILLFFSILPLLEEPVARRSPLLRYLSASFFFFNIFVLAGIIGEELVKANTSEDISSLMAIFYSVIMYVGLGMTVGFSCDPPGKKAFPGLFYSDSRVSAFFPPVIVFINLLLFSLVLMFYQPLLNSEVIKILLSILLSSLILIDLSFMGKIMAKIFNNKAYAQVFILIVILLINLLPLPFYSTNTGAPQKIGGGIFFQPLFSLVSIWVKTDKSLFLEFLGGKFPVYIFSFIVYFIFLSLLFIFSKLVSIRMKYGKNAGEI